MPRLVKRLLIDEELAQDLLASLQLAAEAAQTVDQLNGVTSVQMRLEKEMAWAADNRCPVCTGHGCAHDNDAWISEPCPRCQGLGLVPKD
jgi:DnaJ-class molecular chaperone